MNKLALLFALTPATTILPNASIDYDALKKSHKEYEKLVISELNNSILDCLKKAENYTAFITAYANAARENHPDYDLHADILFKHFLSQYYHLNEACHQKINAMAEIKELDLSKLTVQR